jgi:hypothetical protein
MTSPTSRRAPETFGEDAVVLLDFSGEVFHWRGPAPYHFVALPEEDAAAVPDVAREVTYGWGVIPVRALLGGTEWPTSLFPKNGGFLLPLRVSVRKAEGVALGDLVDVRLAVVRP